MLLPCNLLSRSRPARVRAGVRVRVRARARARVWVEVRVRVGVRNKAGQNARGGPSPERWRSSGDLVEIQWRLAEAPAKARGSLERDLAPRDSARCREIHERFREIQERFREIQERFREIQRDSGETH